VVLIFRLAAGGFRWLRVRVMNLEYPEEYWRLEKNSFITLRQLWAWLAINDGGFI
jgi:hypothetical protein